MDEKIEEKKEKKLSPDKIIDSSVNFLFSNKEIRWLIPIIILGAVLRFIMARNVSCLGDEMVHGPHAIGFLHSGLISTIAHSPLWFYLTDIAMRIFGVTMFSTRFLSFFYGTLSIIVVYLVAAKIFDKKIGLISAFLLSISFYLIRYTLIEMDLSAIFFLLCAIYLFIESVEKNKFPYLAAVCIGIASLIKTLSLFFVPAFLIAFFLFNKGKENRKRNIKHVFLFGIIIILLFSPILFHNYFWYKDKGKVDVYFAQYFFPELRADYAGQMGYASGILFNDFVSGFLYKIKVFFLELDPIIFFFGLFGLILSFSIKEKRKFWIFLASFNFFGFLFLLLSNHLETHYTTLVPIMCIFAGFFVDKLSKNIKGIDIKKSLIIILTIIFIFQIYLLSSYLTSTNSMTYMRDYAISDMDKNSIVVVDGRIYRGRIAWLFNDFHYLESSYLPEILSLNDQSEGQATPVKVYFIECIPDDCGWGATQVKAINASSEAVVNFFSNYSKPEKTIYGGGGYVETKNEPIFNVYSATMYLKPQMISVVDSTHDWFYYPVNYQPKEKIFDNYEVYGAFDNLLYKFAWSIIILSIIFAILFPIFLIIKLIKSFK